MESTGTGTYTYLLTTILFNILFGWAVLSDPDLILRIRIPIYSVVLSGLGAGIFVSDQDLAKLKKPLN